MSTEQPSASGGLTDADLDRLWHDTESDEAAAPADAAPADALDPAVSPETQPADAEAPATAPIGASDGAPEGTTEPQSPDPAESAAPAPDASPAVPEVEEPFTFAVDGTRIDVPGAVKRGAKVEIPVESWDRVVQKHLADRTKFVQREQALRSQVREAQELKATEKLTADAVMQQLHGLMALEDTEFFERVYQMKQQFPLLVKDAQIKALQQQTTRYTQADDQARTVQMAQELEPTFQQGLRGYIDHYAGQDQYRDLGISRDKLYDLLWGNLDKVFYQTGETDPESGYPKFGVHFDYIQRVIDTEARYAQAQVTKEREMRERLAQFEAAAKANAAAAAAKQSRTQAPPAAPARSRAAAPAPAPNTPRKNWRDRLDEIEL